MFNKSFAINLLQFCSSYNVNQKPDRENFNQTKPGDIYIYCMSFGFFANKLITMTQCKANSEFMTFQIFFHTKYEQILREILNFTLNDVKLRLKCD